MENEAIGTGKAGPGRPKGAQNKVTRAVKEAIAQVADDLGGPERMVAWVKEDPANERLFWGTIYPKLLPHTLAGDEDAPLTVKGVIELVRPG
jgi:hypothetical protein